MRCSQLPACRRASARSFAAIWSSVVLGHLLDDARLIEQAPGRADLGEHAVLGLAVALAAVKLRPGLGGVLVVAGERLVGLVRDAVLQHGVVEDPDQAVAAADAGIEEGERLARLECLDPECNLAELDRERVAIDAVDAAGHDLAERVLKLDLGGRAGAAELGDAGGRPARGAEQEVAGAAGGIENRQAQDGGDGVRGVARFGRVQDRVEGGIQEELHERFGGVVGAGLLALVAAGLAAFGEGEGAGVGRGTRRQLEQALVDRAQFLGLHVAPVDPAERLALGAEPGKAPDRGQQAAVGDAGCGEILSRVVGEEAAEGGQAEPQLAVGERLEGRLQALEGVSVLVPSGSAHEALAQAGDAVALGVDPARRGRGGVGMQEVAVLGGEQEDQAVDEAEQLLEVGLRGEVAGGQCLAERGVGRVLDEALAEFLEGRLDAQSELFARGCALGPAALAPALERAVGDRGTYGAEAALLDSVRSALAAAAGLEPTQRMRASVPRRRGAGAARPPEPPPPRRSSRAHRCRSARSRLRGGGCSRRSHAWGTGRARAIHRCPADGAG